ncbi:MAG: hypothetical protein ACYCW6_03645 [Candidatus Xenobia bacterium]
MCSADNNTLLLYARLAEAIPAAAPSPTRPEPPVFPDVTAFTAASDQD